MPAKAVFETDVVLSDNPSLVKILSEIEDPQERAQVAAATAASMHEMGIKIEPNEGEKDLARGVLTATQPPAVAAQSPAVALHLAALLSEYDKQVVENAQQLRTYITNRLIEESNSIDGRIRIRALELLGKITDVGLFTERTEVTIRDKSTEELEQKLKEKLAKVFDGEFSVLDNAMQTAQERVGEVDTVNIFEELPQPLQETPEEAPENTKNTPLKGITPKYSL